MKYLFINSVSGFGSTGRIVAETCRHLTAEGHECRIAYGRKENGAVDIASIPIGGRLDNIIHGMENRLLDNQGFGSFFATLRFLKQAEEFDPDVIWLHNIHGYYLHIGLLFRWLKRSGKQIRWTLHDCWALTGHCAYFDYVGCDRWKTGCHHCPQKGEYPRAMLLDGSSRNYRTKKELFTGIPNLTLIVPSHWLEKRVKESFLGEYPVEVVYNTVDRQIFRPTESDFRERHGLTGKKIVLGVANVWDRRKGLEDFIALAGLLPESYRIVLIGLSEQQIASLPEKILGLPRTSSLTELAEAYTAADVYVTPSTEETFGMTVLEAECCGTKAVVYQDTACEEVAEKFGGIAVPRGPEHLRGAIFQLTEETV